MFIRIYLGVFLFSARGFSVGVFQAVYVYTPEVYPTKHRGSSIGIMVASARVGAIITPFIAQVPITFFWGLSYNYTTEMSHPNIIIIIINS